MRMLCASSTHDAGGFAGDLRGISGGFALMLGDLPQKETLFFGL